MRTRILVLVLAALACACSPGCVTNGPTPEPLHPEPKPDPYEPLPPAPQQTVCERFCALLAGLSCDGKDGNGGQDEVRGNADDVPCVQVCEDTIDKGDYRPDVKCLDRASSCSAAGACLLRL